MKKIELEIIAISHSISQQQSYAVVLGEVMGVRRLPIVIGNFEAQAIAVALERMPPSRPLTHDLLKNVLTAFNVQLQEVFIYEYHEGVFYSKLICYNDSETFEIDCRTSDGMALAIRIGCPIYIDEYILSVAGIVVDEPKNKVPTTKKNIAEAKPLNTFENNLTKMNVDELQALLQEVLEHEDYDKAAYIRDEMNRRKNNNQQ